MKTSKFVLLPLAYGITLLLAASQTQAIDVQGQVEDITQWTQDQVHDYLNKYQIAYDQNTNDQSLLETIKRYRDAAVATADIFVNDQAEAFRRLYEGLRIKLEKSYRLGQNDVQAVIDNIQHNLKELELQGDLTRERVKESLDKLKHDAIAKKHLTDAQWKEIREDIESSFASPTWYQRVFGTTRRFPEGSFYAWLEKSGIPQRLEKDRKLTKDQIDSITKILMSSVSSATNSVSDLSKLGSTDWWTKVSKDIEKNTKLKQDQVQDIIDTMKDEIYAYKIYATDKMNVAAGTSQHVLTKASEYMKNTGYNLYNALVHALDYRAQAKDNLRATASAASSYASGVSSDAANSAASLTRGVGDAFSGATDAVSSSASSVHSQVTGTVNDVKDSFGNYWRNHELNAYKKLGYTEAHIDWISSYLSNTFRDKSTVSKEAVQQALQNIRQYLVDSKVQTENRIDTHLKSFEDLIESWRKAVREDHDEL